MTSYNGIIIDIPGIGRTVDEIYAWIAGTTDQGICSVNNVPMLAAQRRIVEMLEPSVVAISKRAGKTISLVRFEKVEVVKEIKP